MIKEQLNLNLIDDDKESLLTVEPKRSWDGGSMITIKQRGTLTVA